jgi:bifunctional UDP-N-acetylglucosamine pyrophosphorylase / glucosamine-1-phosphate N-acetyltransferase
MVGKDNSITGIILAGGEGKRMNSHMVNKTALPFNGKPIIRYGFDVLQDVVDKTVVVVGAYSESVKKALHGINLVYAYQRKRMGTGHAVKVALTKCDSPRYVIVGYADHMMFYKKKMVGELFNLHTKANATISLVSTIHENPNKIAWGRIVRCSDGTVEKIVEQKDASEEEKSITEVNSGFYCFNFNFLKGNIDKINKSPVTGEYYLTDMIELARAQDKKVCAIKVPFKYVGIGINTKDQLMESQHLYKQLSSD